eukprot:366470-Chlamydomonas_euryale.AAC.3
MCGELAREQPWMPLHGRFCRCMSIPRPSRCAQWTGRLSGQAFKAQLTSNKLKDNPWSGPGFREARVRLLA